MPRTARIIIPEPKMARKYIVASWNYLLFTFLFLCVSGCMSGNINDASISSDGTILAFKDDHGWIFVADNQGSRRLGFSYGGCNLSQDGDMLVWFEGLLDKSCTAVIYYPRVSRRVKVKIPAKAKPAAVMFGPSQSLLLKLYILDNPSEQVAGEKSCTGRTPESQKNAPIPQTEPQYLCWSAITGWTETSVIPKDFVPGAPKVDVFGDSPLVEFGCDGWNARRTVWVRPDGSIVEVVRQNDVLGNALVLIGGFPINFFNVFYWASVSSLSESGAEALKAKDNSAAQTKLERLIRERKMRTSHKQK